MKIRTYVKSLWDEGLDADTIWRRTQERFPHKCCGWAYVSQIIRNLNGGTIIRAKETV